MKVFYNEQGQVVGWVSGSNPDIEEGVKMPSALEATPTTELESAISDIVQPTPLNSLRVIDGEVVVVEAEVEEPPTQPADPDNT